MSLLLLLALQAGARFVKLGGQLQRLCEGSIDSFQQLCWQQQFLGLPVCRVSVGRGCNCMLTVSGICSTAPTQPVQARRD